MSPGKVIRPNLTEKIHLSKELNIKNLWSRQGNKDFSEVNMSQPRERVKDKVDDGELGMRKKFFRLKVRE